MSEPVTAPDPEPAPGSGSVPAPAPPAQRPRPILERIGMAVIALVLASLFAVVALAASHSWASWAQSGA